MVGAHQAAISYVPDGDFREAIHTHSFSEKYERYNSYDVMPTGEGIWGLVVEDRAPVRMTEEELHSHPQFKNFSGLMDDRGLEHPPMPGWLAAPMLSKDSRFLGVLQLTDKFEGDFTKDDEDQLVNLATLFAPTFELQYVNERLQKQADSLNQVTLELRRSNTELEQFAYVASHDLQEPLRMVSSYVQLLAKRYQDKLDEDATEFIEFAVDGAGRMQVLINDLLEYSRVGSQVKQFVPTDLSDTFDQAKTNLSASIGDAGAKIERDALPTVMADTVQMTQLFQNLLSNAIKFRESAKQPDIKVSVEDQETSWVISVNDNGIGIDPKHRERIFLIFQRLHQRREYPGTGIGLAVCKRIVERHDGKIWVNPKSGEETTFSFTMPKILDSGTKIRKVRYVR